VVVERVTFCPACGSGTPQAKPRCEMCNAPLRKERFGWIRRPPALPSPSALVVLVALAVVALVVAVVTAIAYR